MPLGESGQKKLAAILHGLQEVSLALQGQRLLHLTGTAGVVLRTETQVLTYEVTAEAGLDQSVLGKYWELITVEVAWFHASDITSTSDEETKISTVFY